MTLITIGSPEACNAAQKGGNLSSFKVEAS